MRFSIGWYGGGYEVPIFVLGHADGHLCGSVDATGGSVHRGVALLIAVIAGTPLLGAE